MTTTQQRSQMPEPEPCGRCGKLTIYELCDACQTAAFRDGLQLAQASTMMPLPPSVSEAFSAMGQRAPERQRLTSPQQATTKTPQRSLDELTALCDSGEIGGPLDGDEFRATLAAVDAAPVSTPTARDWSGLCLTCVREQRERGVEAVTPELSRVQTCRRHLQAGHALARRLRGEALYDTFAQAFGFGANCQDEKGGAA